MSAQRMRLLVATTNAGKLRDFALAAAETVRIDPLPGLGAIEAPEENESTFEGNARTKAIYYSGFAPGAVVLADDSGLEVDGLGGAPGVRSARYADDCGFTAGASSDERNNLCLMAALRNISMDGRHGRYRSVLVAARDEQVLATGIGSLEGEILTQAQGSGGFGYDPYFLPDGEARSMAELDATAKMTLSHRARALRDLLHRLMESPGDLTG